MAIVIRTNLLGKEGIFNNVDFDQYNGFRAEIVTVIFDDEILTTKFDVVIRIHPTDRDNQHLNGHFVRGVSPAALQFM